MDRGQKVNVAGVSAIVSAASSAPVVIAIDNAASRLGAVEKFGADVTLNNGNEDAVTAIGGITGSGSRRGHFGGRSTGHVHLATALIRPSWRRTAGRCAGGCRGWARDPGATWW